MTITFFTKSYGQEKVYFDRIEKEGGVQLGHVFDLFEGSEGFMWFCTSSGLVKYDGFKFNYFTYNSKDSTSLSSSWIHTGIEDSKGRFWIGTRNGLNLMDRQTEKFRRFFHNKEDSTSLIHNAVRDVYEDSKNRIWIGTVHGVCLFEEENFTFKPVDMPSFLGGRHKPKLLEDNQGNIWVTSANGLYKIDPDKMAAIRLLPEGEVYNPSSNIRGSWSDEAGRIWLGTEKGIWIYDPRTQSFSQLSLPPDLIDNSYSALTEYPEGFLMLGSFNVGLISWDLKNNRLHRRYTRNTLDREGLIVNSIYSLYKDGVDNLWLGTFNGINKINPNAEKFHIYENVVGSENLSNYILSINEDINGRLWLNTKGGPFFKKNINVKSEEFTIPPIERGIYNGIKQFHVDEEQKLWFTLRTFGLYGINQPTQKIIDFVDTGYDKYEENGSTAGDTKNPNLIWVGVEKGLLKYNKKTKTTTWYFPKEQIPEVPSNYMLFLLEGKDGNLWAGIAGGGLVFFDKASEKFTYFAPNVADYSSIIAGNPINMGFSTDGLWLATYKGVSFLKNGENTFVNYLKNDTLFKYGIGGMVVDDENNIWISDGNGISKFDPKTKFFNSYYCIDKIQAFIGGVSAKSSSGQLYFGTTRGLLAFYPDEIFLDTISPKTVFTRFKVNNEPFTFTKATAFVDSIFLTSEAKVFTFEYAGLHFKNAKKIKFKVKLEGFDTHWREVGTKRDATYTNLHPGKYTFLVLNANTDGVWSKKPLAIHLFILPAYWQTNWFYTLIGLVFCTIVYLIYRSRKHTRQLAEAKAIAEQSAKYKSQFLANMSHEIRTPMNAIVGMSKLMLDTNLNEKQQEYASIVQQSAENLLVIINDILDQSKIESGQYTFVSKAFDLAFLTEQLRKIFNYRIKEKGLHCEIIIEKNVPLQLIGDPTRLSQILMNLIGNALKFTSEGDIQLTVKNEKESAETISLLFSVRDTGVGIDTDNLNLIFDSFKQLKNNNERQEQGSGLGLSIAKGLVQSQGGEIWVESKKGEGSCFYFTLDFIKNKEIVSSTLTEVASRPILQKLHFLIVEDTLFNQMLAIELLKKAYPNAKIDVADNGQIAIEKVHQQRYDLILMDVKMPVMDGLEASQLIRKMEGTQKSKTPILAVTANAVPEQLDNCKKAGMNDYITKPINREDLFLKINKQLKINNLQ